jgi:hypothetical protein
MQDKPVTSLNPQLGPQELSRELPEWISVKEEKRLRQLFDEANRKLERAATGESLRDYLREIEELAREVFTREGLAPDLIAIRCAQIVSDYETPKVSGMSDEALKDFIEKLPESSSETPRRSAVSELIYGAARVLLRINVVKATLAQAKMNPWILAADCMSVEEAHQQLIHAGARKSDGRKQTAREAREEKARQRQDRMREWISAHGRFPLNDAVTRTALGYANPDSARARKQFSRDLMAVHATQRLRE